LGADDVHLDAQRAQHTCGGVQGLDDAIHLRLPGIRDQDEALDLAILVEVIVVVVVVVGVVVVVVV
jgi:t-SNARE complex subunit (syntaxin)